MSDENIIRFTQLDANGDPLGGTLEDPEPVKDWVNNILKNTAGMILADDELPTHVAPGSLAASVWRFARLVELVSALAKCWMHTSRLASAEYNKTQALSDGRQEGGRDTDEGGPGQ